MILPKPPEEIFGYIFQNIQGLPVNPRSHKHQQIGTAMAETKANVYGMAELNLNFKMLGPASQWTERFQHLRRNHFVTCTTNMTAVKHAHSTEERLKLQQEHSHTEPSPQVPTNQEWDAGYEPSLRGKTTSKSE
jgi:hypothetical protein